MFREVSDNFALAELQHEPVLTMPREPGLRVPAEAGANVPPQPGFVSISTIDPDSGAALDFAEPEPRFGAASGHVHDVTDMVPV